MAANKGRRLNLNWRSQHKRTDWRSDNPTLIAEDFKSVEGAGSKDLARLASGVPSRLIAQNRRRAWGDADHQKKNGRTAALPRLDMKYKDRRAPMRASVSDERRRR